MFEFFSTNSFSESLFRLDSHIQKQITVKIKFLSTTANPMLFAKRLKGHKGVFRFRSGNYRIVFRLEGQKIILLLVKDRKDIYEGF